MRRKDLHRKYGVMRKQRVEDVCRRQRIEMVGLVQGRERFPVRGNAQKPEDAGSHQPVTQATV